MTDPRFLSMAVVRDRLDPETRRQVRVEPHAVMSVAIGKSGKVHQIVLTDLALADLLRQAATVQHTIVRETR